MFTKEEYLLLLNELKAIYLEGLTEANKERKFELERLMFLTPTKLPALKNVLIGIPEDVLKLYNQSSKLAPETQTKLGLDSTMFKHKAFTIENCINLQSMRWKVENLQLIFEGLLTAKGGSEESRLATFKFLEQDKGFAFNPIDASSIGHAETVRKESFPALVERSILKIKSTAERIQSEYLEVFRRNLVKYRTFVNHSKTENNANSVAYLNYLLIFDIREAFKKQLMDIDEYGFGLKQELRSIVLIVSAKLNVG